MTEPLPQAQIEEVVDLIERLARKIAREEIASLAGLVLSRTGEDDAHLSRSFERNAADDLVRQHLAEIFGEVLKDFGDSETEPGT